MRQPLPVVGRTGPLLLAAVLFTGLHPTHAQSASIGPPNETALEDDRPLEMRALRGTRGDVAALLLTGADSGSLRVAPLVLPECAPGASGPTMTRLWLEIEARSLLEAVAARDESELPESLRLELYAYAMTRGGEIAASLAEFVRVGVGELTELLPGGGAKLAARLELPAGEYQLRVLVREPRSQQFALRVLGFEVPPSTDSEAPYLAPPLFSEASDDWLLVRPRGAGAANRHEAQPPAALPILVGGRSHDFSVRGCRLAGTRLEGRITDLEGTVAAEVAVHLEEATDGDGLLPARLDLPELPAGLYRMDLGARRRAASVSVTLPVFVMPESEAGEHLAWTALGARTADLGEPRTAGEASDRSDRSRGKVDAVVSAYRSSLSLLALGQREEAVNELLQLQLETGDEPNKLQRAIRRLNEAQNRVTRELLDVDSETLLPVLVLHLELHDRILEEEESNQLVLQSIRTRIRALAQVYAEETESSLAGELAALSLYELAAVLERSQQTVSALFALREAIALDPSNVEVLLALAYHFERHGLDRDATTVLTRLLELEPLSDEGRLRLAMNLLRAEQSAEAAELFEGVIRNGSTDWVLTVAYQELGHYLLRRQRFDEAVRLLRQGSRRFPEEQRLRLELAYALDRAGQGRASTEAIAAISAQPGSPSARLRYRVRMPAEDQRTREALVRHATARLPLLHRALVGDGQERP